MARIRADYVFGTTTAALTTTDTALASAELTRLPAVTGSDVAAVTLHDATTGAYEIVHVTAHAAAATTATILRAREGTTAQAWGSGSTWVHSLTTADVSDIIALAGSGTYRGARANASASQAPASGGWVVITLDAESIDTDAYHSTTTNPSRFTVPAGLAGKYQVNATVSYAINATGTRHLSIMKNGVTRSALVTLPSAGGTFRSRVSTTDIMTLAVGDYIHFEAFQDSGAALQIGDTTASGVANETWAAITYLGA